jgi:hypothetical protein
MTSQTVLSSQPPLAESEPECFDPRIDLSDWLQLVRSEYLEMPGLSLTKRQVQRLWNLDPATCELLLAALIDVKFLRLTPDGAYVRADSDIRSFDEFSYAVAVALPIGSSMVTVVPPSGGHAMPICP